LVQQRQGEALRLVGDDSPRRTAALKAAEQFVNTGENRRLDADVLAVIAQEAIMELGA
jgi:alkylhydroperoxidase family enzyme